MVGRKDLTVQFRWRAYGIAILVAVITVLVYLPALQNGFINWDDDIYVYRNQDIRSINFVFLKWAFTAFRAYNWHPLTWLSHAIDYSIWELNPIGHHLTNILFHGLNAFLVFIVATRLMESAKTKEILLFAAEEKRKFFVKAFITGAVAGILFGIHPLHVESVAWVSERKDVLCAFFFLLSIFFYLGYTSSLHEQGQYSHGSSIKRYRQYGFCLLFFIMALMSKPMAVTLPVVLIILDIYPLGRLNKGYGFKSIKKLLAEKIPFLILSAISSVLTIAAQQLLIKEQDIGTRLLVGINAYAFYLVKTVFPVNLAPLYPYPDNISFWSPEVFGTIVILAGITAFCIASWRKNKIYSAVWLYFIVTLLPVTGIVRFGKQMAADS